MDIVKENLRLIIVGYTLVRLNLNLISAKLR